jgi:hypothetical protein
MKSSSVLSHFTALIIITVIMLTIYATVQQSYRTAANDPQLQIARDMKKALSEGKSINKLFPVDNIDLKESLAVFAELFDKNGKPIQSSGLLNGALLQPPQGIFSYTAEHSEDVLTWQPQNNIRIAMVFEKASTTDVGYIGVGRSLKETEIRESNLIRMILIAWIACVGLLLIHSLIQNYLSRRLPLNNNV